MRPFKYIPPDIQSSNLNIPITFYEFVPNSGPEPGEQKKRVLFECFANIYNPSSKDIQMVGSKDVLDSITIKIRDTAGEYLPSTKHGVEIDDLMYAEKTFGIIFVGPDLENHNFIKIIAQVTSL